MQRQSGLDPCNCRHPRLGGCYPTLDPVTNCKILMQGDLCFGFEKIRSPADLLPHTGQNRVTGKKEFTAANSLAKSEPKGRKRKGGMEVGVRLLSHVAIRIPGGLGQ